MHIYYLYCSYLRAHGYQDQTDRQADITAAGAMAFRYAYEFTRVATLRTESLPQTVSNSVLLDLLDLSISRIRVHVVSRLVSGA